MARIDYYAIEQAIKTQLQTYITNAKIFIEKPFVFSPELGRVIFIYFDNRVLDDNQRISHGRRFDYLLNFSIWGFCFSLESVEHACDMRNDLLGEIEIALIRDHQFNSSVNYSWLDGGELITRDEENNFFSGGEVRLVCAATGTI